MKRVEDVMVLFALFVYCPLEMARAGMWVNAWSRTRSRPVRRTVTPPPQCAFSTPGFYSNSVPALSVPALSVPAL
jgi:hypothetical protein